MKNYYEILGVPENAEPHLVERAYRDLTQTFGTDVLATYSLIAPAERERMLKEIEDAHTTLSDPEKRHDYDVWLMAKNPLLYKQESFFRPTAVKVDSPATGPTAAAEVMAEVESRPVAAQTSAPEPAPVSAPKEPIVPVIPQPPVAPAPQIRVEDVIAQISFFDGPALQKVRNARGLSLKDVSAHIKISPTQVRKMEEGDLGSLPSLVYVRGFLRTYAQMLRLDPDRVVKDYLSSARNSLSS